MFGVLEAETLDSMLGREGLILLGVVAMIYVSRGRSVAHA